MNRAEALTDGLGPEDPHNRLHFRVLTIDGARKAFRLEVIYWEALELLAERNGRSVAAEAQARLASAPENLNQASALRASLTSDLLGAWRDSEARAANPDWSAMIAALPAPAFLASRRSVLLAVNEPLLSALQGMRNGLGVPLDTVQGAMNLKVEVPASAALELGRPHGRKFVLCTVAFAAQGQRIACHARLIAAQGAAPEAANLLGLLEPRRA
jgi:predicted DNA-binding ribbon-helix-helix protein